MSDTKGQEVLWQAGERLKTNKKFTFDTVWRLKDYRKKRYYISQSLDVILTLNLTNILLEFWSEFLSHLHYLRILQCSNHKKNSAVIWFHTTYYTFWKKKVCRIPQEFESSCDKNNSDQKCRKLFSYRLDMSQKQQVGNNLSIDIVLTYISTQLMYMYIIQVWWNLESSSVESVTLHASYILSPVQCTMMRFDKIKSGEIFWIIICHEICPKILNFVNLFCD